MKFSKVASRMLAAMPLLFLIAACSSPIPNRNPTGEVFPAVSGESLDEQRVDLPDSLAGSPAVLLIGYEQQTQFDIDRWLMGFIQAGINAPILEIPTIPGLVTSLASGWIDDGMRSGIPEEDWSVVVTLYGSAAQPVAEFTGTENGQNARVVVLDADGSVAWFDDTGYASRKALDVAKLIGSIRQSE